MTSYKSASINTRFGNHESQNSFTQAAKISFMQVVWHVLIMIYRSGSHDHVRKP